MHATIDALGPTPPPHEVQLPSDGSAPHTARRWVTDHLAATGLFPDSSQDGGTLFDVLICTSELVNASMIANSTTMALQLTVREQTVRISLVDDRGDATDPHDERTHAQLIALRILNSLTDDWGIDLVSGMRMFWFEITAGYDT